MTRTGTIQSTISPDGRLNKRPVLGTLPSTEDGEDGREADLTRSLAPTSAPPATGGINLDRVLRPKASPQHPIDHSSQVCGLTAGAKSL
jgi:hypothetical protein